MCLCNPKPRPSARLRKAHAYGGCDDVPRRTRAVNNHSHGRARNQLDVRSGRPRVRRRGPRDRRAGPRVGPKTLAVRVRSRARLLSERDSGGRGTHVTTRAGGLVATIRASLLRHGVCLGPARSSVPWRRRRGSVSVRDEISRSRWPVRARPNPVGNRGARCARGARGARVEASVRDRGRAARRNRGFPRTCCVAATRKEGERDSRPRLSSSRRETKREKCVAWYRLIGRGNLFRT